MPFGSDPFVPLFKVLAPLRQSQGDFLLSRRFLVDFAARGFAGKGILHYTLNCHSREGEEIMTTLTVTARGQVTFRKDVLQHLGIKPGEKIELDLLPEGRGALKAARQTGTIAGFVGLLAGRSKKIATIEEINAVTAQAWSGK